MLVSFLWCAGMGVPGLQTWLRRRYGNAFVPLPDGGFDHVYIDLFSTLHQVIRRGQQSKESACALCKGAAVQRATFIIPSQC